MKPFTVAALALSMLDVAGAAESELLISRAASRQVQAASAQNFTGSVKVEMLLTPTDASHRTSAGSVTFAPGARTAWHTHPLGQTLIVTAGSGWTQCWGGPKKAIQAGDVVHCDCGQKHWHGATDTTAMSHIAIQESLNGTPVTWMEHVTEAEYLAPAQTD